jgi:hypothetical protein
MKNKYTQLEVRSRNSKSSGNLDLERNFAFNSRWVVYAILKSDLIQNATSVIQNIQWL